MLLEVRPSKIGLGAFLTESVKAGGVIVDWSKCSLFENPPRIDPKDRYIEISPGVYIGPLGTIEHPDTYVNHSCRPNAWVRFERPKINLVAMRDIVAGEEVTFDYSSIYEHPWRMNCECGLPECRKIILGKPTSSDSPS